MYSPKKCWISGTVFISSAVDWTVVPVFLVATRLGTASAIGAIVPGGEDALGPRQVVVQKAGVGESAADIRKKRSISRSFSAPQQGREIWNMRKPRS